VTLDLRSTLDGFSVENLKQHLSQIDNDPRYSYYADILRAYLSENVEEVRQFQEDIRVLVSTAASCNPLADLSLIAKNIKKFALVAAINPALDHKLLNSLQKFEHPAIPVFLSANPSADPELKVFSLLAHGQTSDVDEDSIDSWFEYSLDEYEESPSQSIAEISQLLTLEMLGYFKEGGEFPFWQMLEDIDLEPQDKLWKVLGALPRVPAQIYSETPVAINIHVARELAAEKFLSKEAIEELIQDDCPLGEGINNSDSWFISRSPRASVAFSQFVNGEILTRLIHEEISKIEASSQYGDGSMAVLWRIAGNVKLKPAHISLIFDFASRNLPKCSEEMFNYDLLSMLAGGAYVDAPLLNNEAFPQDLISKFESLISDIEKAGQ
jgi:hypothetical protein